jgi:hypothetical protein
MPSLSTKIFNRTSHAKYKIIHREIYVPFAVSYKQMPIKPFTIGEVVFHRISGEKGKIVRVFDDRKYVVKVDLSPPWGQGAIEVLWEAKDVSRRPPHPRPLE